MLLAAVHFVHILSGVIWVGGTWAVSIALFPLLARMEGGEAKALWDRLVPRIGPLMGIASGIAMLFGIVRAWMGGAITSFSDLGSPYGLLVIAALALAVFDGAFGGRKRAQIEKAMTDPATWSAEGPGLCRTAALASVIPVTLIVVIMVMLGLGLY